MFGESEGRVVVSGTVSVDFGTTSRKPFSFSLVQLPGLTDQLQDLLFLPVPLVTFSFSLLSSHFEALMFRVSDQRPGMPGLCLSNSALPLLPAIPVGFRFDSD